MFFQKMYMFIYTEVLDIVLNSMPFYVQGLIMFHPWEDLMMNQQ